MAALVEIPNLVAAISSDLTAAGIRHLISGAAAMAAYGYIRATRDIDIRQGHRVMQTLGLMLAGRE